MGGERCRDLFVLASCLCAFDRGNIIPLRNDVQGPESQSKRPRKGKNVGSHQVRKQDEEEIHQRKEKKRKKEKSRRTATLCLLSPTLGWVEKQKRVEP